MNTLLSTNNYTGLFRNLRKKIDSFPNSRCATASDCIRPIKPESKIVLLEANVYLKDAIRNDFKKTGKCNLQIAKEEFIAIMSTLVLQKNSPYTQSMQQGYEMVRVTEGKGEPSEKGPGLFNYLWNQKSDFLVHDTIPTFQYNSVVDFTMPWIYDYFSFLIPVPDESANINAVVKPFQWPYLLFDHQVWLGLGISIVCVIAVLNLIQRYLEYRSVIVTPSRSKDNPALTEKVIAKGETGKQYLYVFGNLLSQGGPCRSGKLPYRLVAGVWILAAFIFVQAYTSTLFTYVVTPIEQPLIKSVFDIINNGDINLLVRESGTMYPLIATNNYTGIFGHLRKKIDSYPNSKCPSFRSCAEAVKLKYGNVYLETRNYLKDEIRSDYKTTGKCHLQFAKEEFITFVSSFVLQKNSPYTHSMTLGILNLQEIGLVDFWDSWFRPMPPQCPGRPKKEKKSNKLSPLSLKNLTGAFVVLSVGLSLSLLAFLGEKIVSRREQFRIRKDKKLQQDANKFIEVSSQKTEEPIILE
ncbi:glutamate [NMDA] receptor subunit 1-like [Daphnia pulex]|uniref:glutamate [NMDA] receptor subunit 1-like n=1 Tax=Daphnia pulex TaxID=6669 RepID=UPI001EDD227E|nr:glutamate [NMDA] receptor subunit 1-like [Daphnia pulex]